jgi:RNA recognition motif-containing protein
MIDLRGGRLLFVAGLVAAPLVITGYVGLTLLVFLPLLGLRMIFPRRRSSGFMRSRRQEGGKESVMKLFVGNLSFEVTGTDLRTAFAAYGQVSSADVVTDRESGRSRGFGFIEMPLRVNAVAAMQALDGTDMKGRSVNVSEARPRNDGGGRRDAPAGWAVAGTGRNRW